MLLLVSGSLAAKVVAAKIPSSPERRKHRYLKTQIHLLRIPRHVDESVKLLGFVRELWSRPDSAFFYSSFLFVCIVLLRKVLKRLGFYRR